jgi:hypothetical protein
MGFDELLFQLENAKSIAAKTRLVREFAHANTSPVIEDNRVTFFYISEDAQTVALEGDWTHGKPTAPMEYLPDTPYGIGLNDFRARRAWSTASSSTGVRASIHATHALRRWGTDSIPKSSCPITTHRVN